MMALGLVETVGWIPAVESADVMLKAADVALLEKNLTGAGLVTVSVGGEVAAVRAAVDAACEAVRRIDGARLVAAHVIPRPYAELGKMVRLLAQEGASAQSGAQTLQPRQPSAARAEPPAPAAPVLTAEKLKRWSVKRLREWAMAMPEFPMAQEAIGRADKKSLIAGIMRASGHREE